MTPKTLDTLRLTALSLLVSPLLLSYPAQAEEENIPEMEAVIEAMPDVRPEPAAGSVARSYVPNDPDLETIKMIRPAQLSGQAQFNQIDLGKRPLPHETLFLTGDRFFGAIAENAPYEPVRGRKNRDTLPLGARLGQFLFFPEITVSQAYTDNLYREEANEESDFITYVQPQFRLIPLADSYHTVSLSGWASQSLHADNSSEDATTGGVSANAKARLGSSLSVAASGMVQWFVEDRANISQANALTEPLTGREMRADVSVDYRPNRMGVTAYAGVEDTRYRSAFRRIAGGHDIRDDEDRLKTYFGLRPSYTIQAAFEYEIFAMAELNEVDYRRRSYQRATGRYDGVDKDSDGFRTAIGAKIPVREHWAVSGQLGYLEQEYDKTPNGQDVSGLFAEAQVQGNITELTTVSLAVERDVRETISDGGLGVEVLGVGAQVDHELRRDMIVSAGTKWSQSDFIDSTREDDMLSARLGFEYFMGRSATLAASYAWTDVDSNQDTEDFQENRVLLSVNLAF